MGRLRLAGKGWSAGRGFAARLGNGQFGVRRLKPLR